MEIKVTKAVGSKTRTVTSLEFLQAVEAPDRIKKQIKRDVGEFLVSKIIEAAGGSKSIVEGESFPGLSKEYKKRKIAAGLPGKADLRFEGELLGDLTWSETRDGIDLGWFGNQAAKADGHVNFSGDSPLPLRRSIPGEGQSFKPSINREIERIVASHLAESQNGKD